ncbi:hypothetical protein ACFSOZ_33960 [Mesorhizobium newzealandense]|uniref:5-methylcytosine-specific restriction endonuclease system specificity protein McrC n=1 Tax=Mesorhizobium newzealandense TaxID=1300302 RepID=A0ABW4UKJ7_9HYPH
MTLLAPSIPIENIYYLFCYAWDRFEEAKAISVEGISSPDLPNLLARVLLVGTRNLLRRGLDRGYQPHEEDIATLRGQIDLGGTVRLWSRRARRLHCLFDELSHDVLHNQILKASLCRLAKAPTLDRNLARDLLKVSRHFVDVTDIRLDRRVFSRVQLHRNISGYGLVLRVAELAFDSLLPAPGRSGYQFHDVLRDERKMAAVFEAFVRNFYRNEQRKYSVEPLHIRWDAELISDDGAGQLPNMRVDVFLRSPQRQLIIDTKYYSDALQTYRGASTFHSSHLYQLFAYLRNAHGAGEHTRCDGLLLYPEARSRPDAVYRVHGHVVKIATVNLAQPWQLIARRLHDLVLEP